MIDHSKVSDELLQLPEPILSIVGEVNYEMYLYVMRSLMFLRSRGSPPLQLIIDSGGGNVESGLDIFDALRLYPNPVTGLVMGRAASMAAAILQACQKRQCARHASILIHHVSRQNVGYDEIKTSARRKKMLDKMEVHHGRLYKIFADRTGQPLTTIRRTCRRDEFMESEDALNFGLVDEIV